MRLQFTGRPHTHVAMVLELQIVDLDTFQPVPAAAPILEQLSEEPIREGLFQSTLVIETEVCPSIDACARALRRTLAAVQLACQQRGLGIIAAGTHPTAGWRELHLSRSPATAAFIRRLQWVGRRAAVSCLRIQVGVPDGEKAIAIGNALACLMPLLVALSASSPFWRGYDTGLASCRTRVIENIPNAGIPPNLLNFGEFQSYVKTLRAAESIETLGDIWWDVRPNVRRGMLETQACDMPHTAREALALAAFTQVLVAWLLDAYQQGEVIPYQDTWMIRENKWRAARFGIDAELIDSLEGDLITTRALYSRLRTLLQPMAESLGASPYLEDLDQVLVSGPGYVRQHRVAGRLGLEQVVPRLMEELISDVALP